MKQGYKILLLLVGIIAETGISNGQIRPRKHHADLIDPAPTLVSTSSSWVPTDTDFCYLNYIENKGQWNSKVLYQSDFHGGRVFLEKNAFTYVFFPAQGFEQFHPHKSVNAADSFNSPLTLQAVRMEFVNSTNASVKPTEQKEFYNNYYMGNDPKHWASEAHAYGKIYYNELYPGITAKVFSRSNDIRYDFIIAPSANPSSIKLKFTGQNNLALKDGNLIIQTEVGNITEAIPYAYQMVDGEKVKVNCSYTLQENRVGFKMDKYNTALPLIIDPTLVFCTYTGSTVDNWGMSATYDAAGDGYTSGICFGVGYPITLGAYMVTFQGGGNGGGNWYAGFDIVVSKFNPTGTSLLFSTYLGGSDNEQPSSLIVDGNNDLILLGRSYSTNFPTTAGAYSNTSKGGADLIISKFNPTGTALLASTYIGGSGDDGVNGSALESVLVDLKYNYADDDRGDVIVDNSNNIYVAECTSSPNFPTTAGAYRTFPLGMQDGCVFKMNSSLTTLNWSTYIGGSNNDAAYNLALNSRGEVYVTGGTESANFPTTAGVIDPVYQGNIDGFLCHFSANGSTLLNSTYIGTAGYDQSYFVQTDKYDNVYVYGQTSGAYPITGGVYSVPHSGQFIHEMNQTLTGTTFSTEFGSGRGTPDIAPSAFLVDNCENIYVAGWGGTLYSYNVPTSSTLGLPTTANAFQPATTGHDFYFMVLQNQASALWYATFFGGPFSLSHVDGGTSRFDKDGVIYQSMCAGCGGYSDIPTTPGAWSNTNNSSNCNNAIVKFKMDLLHTVASFIINPLLTAGCAPFSVTFNNTTNYGNTYKWYFGDGDSSNTPTPNHIYNTPGTYKVKLIATDSSTCNVTDTAYATVRVVPPLLMNPIPNTSICYGDSVNLNAVSPGASSFKWTPSAGLNNAVINNPDASPAATTSYIVTAKDSFCSAVDTVMVKVYRNQAKIIPGEPKLCIGQTITLSSDSAEASYIWSSGQTTSAATVDSGGVYYLSALDNHGCKAKDSVNVEAFKKVPLLMHDASICIGQNVHLLVDSGNYTYQWAPPASLSSTNTFNPVATPSVTTSYTLQVTNGPCISRDSITVVVNPNPKLIATPDSVMILYGESVKLTAEGDPGWVWYPWIGLSCTDCPATIASPDTNSVYYVKVTNKYGCVAKDSVIIDIQPTFFIPDAFSPNGDGLNDVFRPRMYGYTNLEAYIFDRWGSLIYHWNTLYGGWDGTINGNKVQEDTYVYMIKAMDYTHKTLQKIGSVTLLR